MASYLTLAYGFAL